MIQIHEHPAAEKDNSQVKFLIIYPPDCQTRSLNRTLSKLLTRNFMQHKILSDVPAFVGNNFQQ